MANTESLIINGIEYIKVCNNYYRENIPISEEFNKYSPTMYNLVEINNKQEVCIVGTIDAKSVIEGEEVRLSNVKIYESFIKSPIIKISVSYINYSSLEGENEVKVDHSEVSYCTFTCNDYIEIHCTEVEFLEGELDKVALLCTQAICDAEDIMTLVKDNCLILEMFEG